MIPESAADITPEWLTSVLSVDVTDVRAENLGEGLGLLGEVARLHLKYAPGANGPPTLIAKCQSPALENRFVAQLMGFYAREVNFYSHLSNSIPLRCPPTSRWQGCRPSGY